MSAFPVRFYCSDNYGWADCPQLARAVWMRLRNSLAPQLIWYAADMEVLSPTSIRLYVYEMADNFRGGIGKCIYETTVDEFTTDERVMLSWTVVGIYTRLAEVAFSAAEEKKRNDQILKLRKEMFGV